MNITMKKVLMKVPILLCWPVGALLLIFGMGTCPRESYAAIRAFVPITIGLFILLFAIHKT